MPYQKDFIGQTPYYIKQDMERFFKRKHCHNIIGTLDNINITVIVLFLPFGCKIKYQDNYLEINLTSKYF